VALGADLVGRDRGEVLAPKLLPLLVHERPQGSVERAQQGDPGALATGDLVELLLHPGGEGEIHVLAEVLHEQVGDDLGDRLRVEAALTDHDIAAIDDRGQRGRVG
jgi:hypothetical protein